MNAINRFLSLLARLRGKKVFIDRKGVVRASTNIKIGETIDITPDEYWRVSNAFNDSEKNLMEWLKKRDH